jgi:hypothetical protein
MFAQHSSGHRACSTVRKAHQLIRGRVVTLTELSAVQRYRYVFMQRLNAGKRTRLSNHDGSLAPRMLSRAQALFSLQALALRKACLEMEVPPNFLETGAGEPSSKRFAQTSQKTATAHGGLHTLVWRESRDVPFVRQFPIYTSTSSSRSLNCGEKKKQKRATCSCSDDWFANEGFFPALSSRCCCTCVR